MPTDNSIGQRMKKWREFAGMTQEDVGHGIGVSSKKISNIERGKTIPTAPLIASLGAHFHVDVLWLLYGNDLPPGLKKDYGRAIPPEDIKLLKYLRQHFQGETESNGNAD